MVTVRNPPPPKLSDELYAAMQSIMDALFAARDAGNRDVSESFHSLLPKRQFSHYYRTIRSPQAMKPVENNIKKKNYTTFKDFVKDTAQIYHNAKLYNRHDSQIYSDAETLEGVLKDELAKVKDAGLIPESDAMLPDLGPLPPPSPTISPKSPSADPDEDSAAEEEEDEEEEEEEEETKKRPSRRRRPTKKELDEEEDEGAEKETQRQKEMMDPRRKRGRPPRVDTPMELRVKNIFKALRKLKDDKINHVRIIAFERLPEKKEFPEYFSEIKNPIALDIIRKSVKRREYKTLDDFAKDMDLMFENAKAFNEENSQIYKDAVLLQEEMHKAAEIEKAKKDEELTGGEDTQKQAKLPLDKIEHKGITYVVGDWIHIVNPNDPNKPTVGQIFREWKDSDGQIWINACWYYRPEQTVHWVEKKFYEAEVVKTGQYRDHHIDEILGKCFVMFFTRYSRGRPKGWDEKRWPIYVCESRYNEIEKHFNKIKTWKSCIPDEVRGQDYDVTLFDKQQVLKKMPSPILHLLPSNAKEDDPLPDAQMGVDNAPPIIGAVFKRARRDNDSPAPEPTPPPQPVLPTPTPAPTRANPDYHETMSMTQMYKQAHLAASTTPSAHQQYPPVTPQTPHGQHQNGYLPSPQQQRQQHGLPYLTLQQQQLYQQRNEHQHQLQLQQLQHQHQHKQYNPPIPPTTFTLPDSITNNIPEETAQQFLRDPEGKLLWFTVPPLETTTYIGNGPKHSLVYLARKKEIEERKRKRREEVAEQARDPAREKARRLEVLSVKEAAQQALAKSLDVWNSQMRRDIVVGNGSVGHDDTEISENVL